MSEEIWLPVVGYEGYEVSNQGRVYSHRTKKILVGGVSLHKKGYPFVNLRKDGKTYLELIHRLMATAFIGEIPKGYQINHKDGVKTNNNLDNLEIVTPAENMKHARGTGLNKPHKLTDEKVQEILTLIEQDLPHDEIAIRYGITSSMVSKINTGVEWSHIEGYRRRYKMTADQAREIKKSLRDDPSATNVKRLAARYGVGRKLIEQIRRGSKWKSVE